MSDPMQVGLMEFFCNIFKSLVLLSMYKAPTNKFTFSQPENEYVMLDSTEQFCARLLKNGLSLWMKMRTN